jgi:hypothetical protein
LNPAFELDSELHLWFSGWGKVRPRFDNDTDIRRLGRLLADHCA